MDDRRGGAGAPQQGYGLQDLEGDLAAGWNGGVDAATLGLADPVGAASAATYDALRGRDWFNSYKDVRAQQTARDRYDAAHHALARNAGQAIGTIVDMAATDGLTAAPVGARIAFTKPVLEPTVASMVRYLRPWGAAAGVGAGASLAGQGVSDMASGHLSSPQTYAADAIGGAAGGMATLQRGPTAGAAADSLASGAARSALTGQPMDLDEMERNALGGSYLGVLGHVAATKAADNLPWTKKGKLGEFMAERTSNILGDQIDREHPKRFNVSGGKTVADHVTDQGAVEAKFGWSAKLSKRQNEAFRELPDYHVYHFLPEDVGRITGGLLALAGMNVLSDRKEKRR
jgi:hypothetical protein